MRYATQESTVILGYLSPNTAVTIKIINTKTDELVTIGDGVCVESQHIAGVYRYLIDNSQIGEIEIAYEMSNGKDSYGGKLVIGGYANTHDELDSYVNKDAWKVSPIEVRDRVWDKIV